MLETRSYSTKLKDFSFWTSEVCTILVLRIWETDLQVEYSILLQLLWLYIACNKSSNSTDPNFFEYISVP